MIDFLLDLKPDQVQGYASDFVQYLRSPRFKEDIERVRKDDEARAGLAVTMLYNAALSPTAGTELKDFLTVIEGNPNRIEFRLFYCAVPNPVGKFTLPVTSPRCAEVITAIVDNLDSQGFKIAKFARAIEENRVARHQRRRARMAAVKAKALAHYESRPPSSLGWGQLTEADRGSPEHLEMIKEQAASDARYFLERCQGRTLRRVDRLNRKTHTDFFKGNYTAILAKLVADGIAPAEVIRVPPAKDYCY